MKKLITTTPNGFPWTLEDIALVQDETMLASLAMYSGKGLAFVLSGCEVSIPNPSFPEVINIASGIVFIDDEVLRFDGVSNLNLGTDNYAIKKAETPIESNPQLFEDDISRNTITERKAVVAVYVEEIEEEE